MFIIHQLPRLHFLHIPIRLILITSTLLSNTNPVSIPKSRTGPASLSHFSTSTSQSPHQEKIQLSLEKLFVPPETEVSEPENGILSARILKGSNIVLSKYAGGGAEVVNAEFLKSSVTTEDCPSNGLPEFALVGRSNVGKSSLLNSLVRRKRLALTSKKPDIYFISSSSCLDKGKSSRMMEPQVVDLAGDMPPSKIADEASLLTESASQPPFPSLQRYI
ncbi:GTP-binding protein At2g22870-like [Olea europaea var. sylvestris]|uniref:GTP-binding protein At2g22870-like n=1 Tax=Olea europaea var. sylvestris TaxID=158386 RepID=UPI000C1D5CFC|nr:GTP-binding protein At2g22870-like [Olea europaea var. sylvestris]